MLIKIRGLMQYCWDEDHILEHAGNIRGKGGHYDISIVRSVTTHPMRSWLSYYFVLRALRKWWHARLPPFFTFCSTFSLVAARSRILQQAKSRLILVVASHLHIFAWKHGSLWVSFILLHLKPEIVFQKKSQFPAPQNDSCLYPWAKKCGWAVIVYAILTTFYISF